MAQKDFIYNLIGGLGKTKSIKQIKADLKTFGDVYMKLVGNLDMPKTRKYIKNQLKGLNLSFTMTPTVNTKGVQQSMKQAVTNAQKIASSNKVQFTLEMDKAKLQNQLKNFAKENSKLFTSKEMTAKYNQLVDSTAIAKSKSELKALRSQLSAFRTELVATGKSGMTWINKFKASISHFAQYFSGASFIYFMTNQFRSAWTEAKTLDDSLTDLMKVTNEIEDRDALYKYFDKAMNKAKELNVTVDSLIYAITEFKKLGWSLSDAELGGQWATILENVGDVDIDTAIGSIKTAVASFDEIGGYGNDQMDKKLEAYVDLINNMSNKYSIDAEGLAEAIRLSAGTLTEANTSIEQAATMFATANKYYNDPDYLGNTAKIGSLRLRATTGDDDAIKELSEMGEDVEEVTALTGKLREELIALTGVDIMIDNNTFKSYYDQLYEMEDYLLYLRQCGLQPNSISTKMNGLSVFYKYLIKQGVTMFNPIYYIPKPHKLKTEEHKHYLSDEKVELLKEKLEEYGDRTLQVYAMFSLSTREFDTSKSKKVLQSLETGLFFCQIFSFII